VALHRERVGDHQEGGISGTNLRELRHTVGGAAFGCGERVPQYRERSRRATASSPAPRASCTDLATEELAGD
jgi:hypothetical protein